MFYLYGRVGSILPQHLSPISVELLCKHICKHLLNHQEVNVYGQVCVFVKSVDIMPLCAPSVSNYSFFCLLWARSRTFGPGTVLSASLLPPPSKWTRWTPFATLCRRSSRFYGNPSSTSTTRYRQTCVCVCIVKEGIAVYITRQYGCSKGTIAYVYFSMEILVDSSLCC